MHIVPLSSIAIPPNRQRRQFDPKGIEELADSMKRLGLIQPIALRDNGIGSGLFELVAGERRFRVAQLLEWKDIPAHFLSEMSEIDRFEAELHENILRVDLTWQERLAAIAELHRLRTIADPSHSQSATAKELAATGSTGVRNAQIGIQHALTIEKFRDDPQVMSARTPQEAYKIATAKLQAEFAGDLRAQVAGKLSDHTLVIADCVEWMSGLCDPGTFDLIITDPPYGMGADSFGDAGPRHKYKDDESLISLAIEIIERGYTSCKPQAHLYLFCDIDWFHTLRAAATKAGWYAWRTPITWWKGTSMGHNPIPEIGFRRTTEWILYAVKGNRPATMLLPDCLFNPNVGHTSTPEHPAAKPVWLYELLIRRSCLPGSSIFDPCCGTGTVFEAATKCHVRAIGVEIDEGFATYAKARM